MKAPEGKLSGIFGKRLLAWRKSNFLKQDALAAMVVCSQSVISRLEHGLDEPSTAVAARIRSLMGASRSDDLAIECAVLPRLPGIRALFDLDGIALHAASRGFTDLWPRLSAEPNRKLADFLVNEAALLLHDRSYQQEIATGALIMASGVSLSHLALPQDDDFAFKHRWHANFRNIGGRLMIDMTYEHCEAESPVGLSDMLRIDEIEA